MDQLATVIKDLDVAAVRYYAALIANGRTKELARAMVVEFIEQAWQELEQTPLVDLR